MTPETREAIERLKEDLDFFDDIELGEGIRDEHAADLRTLIAAIEAMEPIPKSKINQYDPRKYLYFYPGGEWRTWSFYTENGSMKFATHAIPLSALPQPEVGQKQ